MPLNTAAVFKKPYKERSDADARELSAIRLVQALLGARGVLASHRQEMLRIALYKYSEARAGKHGVRYRTSGVMDLDTPRMVEHEHVRSRQSILADLLAGGPELSPLVLSTSVVCLVTKEEHARLTSLSKGVSGWARYAEAEIDVFDFKLGQQASLSQLEGEETTVDVPSLKQLLVGGPARICLLTACRLSDPQWTGGWAVLASARDSESVEGHWLDDRMRSTGDEDNPSSGVVENAARIAAEVFNSSLLRGAAPLLAQAAAVARGSSPARSSLSADLVRLTESDQTLQGTPSAVPLIRAVLAASQQTQVPSWEEVVRDTAGGRYAQFVKATDDRYASLRAVSAEMADPLLDLALTIFEKRGRGALSVPPPATVVEWIRRRCGT